MTNIQAREHGKVIKTHVENAAPMLMREWLDLNHHLPLEIKGDIRRMEGGDTETFDLGAGGEFTITVYEIQGRV